MVHNASTPRRRDMADASVRLDRLEAIKQPTEFARGALAAVRMATLEPAERTRAENLHRRWAKS